MDEINPYIAFDSEYEGARNPIHYTCLRCGYKGVTTPSSLLSGHGCRKCMGIKAHDRLAHTHEDFCKKVADFAGDDYVVVGRYYNRATPVDIFHRVCGGTFAKRPGNPIHKDMCPYCSHRKILSGFNDLSTTNPAKAALLADQSLGEKVFENSPIKVDMRCPYCGKISQKWLTRIDESNFSCPHCSPTYSYPERVLMSVLSNAGIFFVHDSTMPWSQGKRYDFIIENCIICETHGIQHYDTDNPFSYTYKDSSIEENDRFKMQLAYSNGFDHYVVIDCKVSNFEYIKNNILKSDLPKLICLGDVDWDICKRDCQSYRDVNIANAYNSGQKVGEIARQMSISKDAIRRALHKASGTGFCNYDSQLELHNSWFKCGSSVHDCAT